MRKIILRGTEFEITSDPTMGIFRRLVESGGDRYLTAAGGGSSDGGMTVLVSMSRFVGAVINRPQEWMDECTVEEVVRAANEIMAEWQNSDFFRGQTGGQEKLASPSGSSSGTQSPSSPEPTAGG